MTGAQVRQRLTAELTLAKRRGIIAGFDVGPCNATTLSLTNGGSHTTRGTLDTLAWLRQLGHAIGSRPTLSERATLLAGTNPATGDAPSTTAKAPTRAPKRPSAGRRDTDHRSAGAPPELPMA